MEEREGGERKAILESLFNGCKKGGGGEKKKSKTRKGWLKLKIFNMTRDLLVLENLIKYC